MSDFISSIPFLPTSIAPGNELLGAVNPGGAVAPFNNARARNRATLLQQQQQDVPPVIDIPERRRGAKQAQGQPFGVTANPRAPDGPLVVEASQRVRLSIQNNPLYIFLTIVAGLLGGVGPSLLSKNVSKTDTHLVATAPSGAPASTNGLPAAVGTAISNGTVNVNNPYSLILYLLLNQGQPITTPQLQAIRLLFGGSRDGDRAFWEEWENSGRIWFNEVFTACIRKALERLHANENYVDPPTFTFLRLVMTANTTIRVNFAELVKNQINLNRVKSTKINPSIRVTNDVAMDMTESVHWFKKYVQWNDYLLDYEIVVVQDVVAESSYVAPKRAKLNFD